MAESGNKSPPESEVNIDKTYPSSPSTPVMAHTLIHCNQVAQLPPQSPRVAKAIGKKALVQSYLNGLAIIFFLNSGSQVIILISAWKEEYVPDLSIYSVSEILGDEELKVPYDSI